MQFVDTILFDGARKTRDGFLVGRAKTARTGIQIYSGREVDPDNEHGLRDRAEVRVYRSPEAVFNRDTMSGMAHRTVTVNHPAEMVTADNWKEHAAGFTDSEVVRDGEFVVVPLTLMDRRAVDAWENGHRELSWGYTSELKFGDGVTPAGEAFDAEMTNIKPNHLAICLAARGGPELRLDSQGQQQKERAMPDTTRAVLVDGITYPMTDQGAQLVERLQGLLGQAATKLTDQATAHATVLAAKDTELATKDSEIEKLTAQVITGDALDKLIADRAKVITGAKALDANVVIDGKSNIEVIRAVIGDAAKDQSDDYARAAFDLKVAALGDTAAGDADPLRSFVKDAAGAQVKDAVTAARDAKAARIQRLQTGYQAVEAA